MRQKGSSPISKLRAHTVISKQFHTMLRRHCIALASLRQASPTSVPHMHMLADAAGPTTTKAEKRSAKAAGRRTCMCTTQREPPPHVRSKGGAGARSLPGLTTATSRQANPNPRPTAGLASRPSRQLDSHRTVAQAQPGSRRARSDQRRFQALSRCDGESAEHRL